MKINNLTLKNFLSFKDASLDLGGRQIALILGRNNDTTSMDSNGSGKSTILEAVVWGLFGRTCRGLKGDAVVNSVARKNCEVSLALSVNGSKVTLTRHRKHAVHKDDLILEIDGQEQKRMTLTETQALLEDTIHMNYETFMNTTIFPQGAFTYFASMADADRKDLLESVMGMVPFDEYQRRAKDRQKEIQGTIDELTTDLTVVQSSMETEEQRKVDLTRKDIDFADEKKDTLMGIEDGIGKLNRELGTLKTRIFGLDLEKTEESIKLKKKGLESLKVDEETVKRLIRSIAEKETEERSLEAQKTELEIELIDLRKLKPGQKCPLCKQPIKGDIKEHLKEVQTKTENFERQRVEKGFMIEKYQESLDITNNQDKAYKKVEDEIEGDMDRLEELRREQMQLAPSRERILAEIEAARKDYTETEKKESPYASMIKDSEKKLKELATDKEKIESGIVAFRKDQEYVQFWVEGFGDRGLKSFLLDSVVQQLNERANHYLSYLTDGKVRVEISTRTRLKGGEEREKLDIRVYSKEGLQEYLGSSGGEKRRADLSMLLALRELAKARLEQTFDLLFVDEVFDVLDQSGIERVIHLLTQQAGDDVFVISHDPSLMDAFEEVITVEKTDGLSRII